MQPTTMKMAEFIEKQQERRVIVFGSDYQNRTGVGLIIALFTVSGKEAGYEAVIVNNNPETVSTDFDISDRLYFEPLTPEDVDGILETEKPWGAIVQFGGQTAIKLTKYLTKKGVNILGTDGDSIDAAEDRERFDKVLEDCGIPRAEGKMAYTTGEAVRGAEELGYPVLIRPSYVLGGQNMIIAYGAEDVIEYMDIITRYSENPFSLTSISWGWK